MKGGGKDAEQENGGSENVEVRTEMAGEQATGYGTKSSADEAEAGDGERGAESGLKDDHGGDGGRMGFREFEDAGDEEGHGGADGGAGGVFQRLAVQADRSCGDGLGHRLGHARLLQGIVALWVRIEIRN